MTQRKHQDAAFVKERKGSDQSFPIPVSRDQKFTRAQSDVTKPVFWFCGDHAETHALRACANISQKARVIEDETLSARITSASHQDLNSTGYRLLCKSRGRMRTTQLISISSEKEWSCWWWRRLTGPRKHRVTSWQSSTVYKRLKTVSRAFKHFTI